MDKRQHQRELTMKTARIVVGRFEPSVDCAILNMSDGGACVLVASPADVPDAFELTTDPEGRSHACTVVWKSGNKIGVAFK